MSYTLIDAITKEAVMANYTEYLSPSNNLLDIVSSPNFDNIIAHKNSMWRYKNAIAIQNDNCIVSMNEGFTSLNKISFMQGEAYIKQEQLFSTGSYKDRGASVLISRAKELGVKEIVQDSSGNAACAIAAYAALAGIKCYIYLSHNTSPAKVAQIKAYGANVIKVNGDREATAQAAKKAASTMYYASHCYNPWFFEGTKTFAFELCEQLNWQAPHAVVLPAGNGTLVLGCYIGFMQLLQAKKINFLPKIIAIQSQNCAPLASMFNNNHIQLQATYNTPTIAEGIAIAMPARGIQIVNAVKQTKGHFITVSEEEIITSLKYCASIGYFIEPTSAATIAGLEKYLALHKEEKIVSLFSGHGLKAISTWL